jgi:peptide/nickel transport system ATP-binding protein
MSAPILEIRRLTVDYRLGAGAFSLGREVVHAVDDVSLVVPAGRTLGLVGESGSGKTTLGRTLVGLTGPAAGEILLDGAPVDFGRTGLRRLRGSVQMIFQSASASLDPRIRVGRSIAEPIGSWGSASRERVEQLLELVGMDASDAEKYPQELSGGQQQRVGIARALAARPRVLICDESVSGLDVSMQAQILKLLGRLQEELGLTYVFISHDLAVVRLFAADLAVMYRGRIVERGPAHEVFANPQDDYTRKLLAAVLLPDPRSERRRPARAGANGAS